MHRHPWNLHCFMVSYDAYSPCSTILVISSHKTNATKGLQERYLDESYRPTDCLDDATFSADTAEQTLLPPLVWGVEVEATSFTS